MYMRICSVNDGLRILTVFVYNVIGTLTCIINLHCIDNIFLWSVKFLYDVI